MIAIIAGTGNLPVQACKSLIEQNKDFFVISLFPEDNNLELKNIVNNGIYNNPEVIEQKFYKASKILKTLKEKKTTHVLFIGKVDKRNLFKNLKFDWLTIKFLASCACKSDKTIMENLLSFLKKEEIEVLSQHEILKNLFLAPGVLTGKLTPEIKENIDYGISLANNISLFDIGQTVVVKDKMVLAVEAIEGTDECIKRGISLGEKNLIICKTAHKNHNKKYDLPTLGPNSLKNLEYGQVKAIAWQSSQTFIENSKEFIKKAETLGITLVSL